MRSRRFLFIVVVLGLLVGAAAFWGANKEIIGLFHDDGVYVVVAKALAQGDGYRIISLPGAPPQTKYPFLYSYLLSWLWALNPNFPENVALLKIFNTALVAVIFVLSAVFYRRLFADSCVGALVFAFFVSANPIIFTFSDYAVSDLLFVVLALGALVLASSATPSSTWRSSLSLAAVAGLACLTRLAAAPLVFAGAVQSFMSHRRRGAIYFLVGVVLTVAPWFFWVSAWHKYSADSLFGYYSAYHLADERMGGVGALFSRHWEVVAGNAQFLRDTFDLLYVLPLLPGLWFFVAALTVAGMVASARKREIFLWCFFLSSLSLLLIWPFHPGRYSAPLVPIIIFFLFRGAHSVEQRLLSFEWNLTFRELLAKIVWVPVMLILPLQGVWLSSYLFLKDELTTRALFGKRLPYAWQGFEESFAWVRRNTRPDSLLATAYDPMYYLYTDRRAIRPALHRPTTYFYPRSEPSADVGSPGEIKAQLDQLQVDYLVIDPLNGYAEGNATLRLMDGLVTAYGDKARSVFTSADGKHRIYAIEK